MSTHPGHPDRPGPRLPSLGRRGGGWVAGQLLLMAAVFLSALLGRSWPDGYAVAAYLVGAAVLGAGLLLLAWGGRSLGSALTPFPAPRARDGVKSAGPYALVRHPMYGGGILVALGWTIVFATPLGLALTIVLALFLDLKARREEAWLRERLAGYDEYCTRTRHRLLPFVY